MTSPAQGQGEKKKKVGSSRSTLKRQRQNESKRLINKNYHSQVRTAVKSYQESLKGSDKEKQQALLNEVFSFVDKAVNKGIFKANKASRIKSRLVARIHQ